MSAVQLYGRNGLGDAIYMRPVVRAALQQHGEVYLNTAWPQLYTDLPVRCLPPMSSLAVPLRNAAQHADRYWAGPVPPMPARDCRYAWTKLKRINLLAQLERRAKVRITGGLDLPPLPPSPIQQDRIAVVRPVTLRHDWPNPARNPRAGYVARAAERLLAQGYHVVSVAHIEAGVEDLVGDQIPASVRYESGELDPLQLLALVAAADIVVGAVGWVVPACLATRTPLVVIAGGRGGCDAPDCLLPRHIPARHIHWIVPDSYCRCVKKTHDCPKQITYFDAFFQEAMARQPTRAVA